MRRLLALLALLLSACAHEPRAFAPRGPVKTGLDVLEESRFRALQGKRVGLITNQTGKDRRGRGIVEVLAGAPGVTLAAVFSPEHGFTGTSEELAVSSSTLRLGGREVPVHSLYSGGLAGMRPSQEHLKGLDALVFDIQDIGARFYTYLATMGMALEEAAKAGIEFVVLDRPDPVDGETVEGPVLEDLSLRAVTAIAYFRVPIRHGMTAGEMALLHNAEVKHPRLTVVRMEGWERRMWFDQTGLPWTRPSPNMPDLASATLYPGIACLEDTNLSVGRGTPAPFRWIGAPWLDGEALSKRLNASRLEGIRFSPQDHTPAKSAHEGKLCHGVSMKVTDRLALRPFKVFVHIAAALRDLHRAEFELRWDETRRLVGSERFKALYDSGAAPEEIVRSFEEEARRFASERRPYLLYR